LEAMKCLATVLAASAWALLLPRGDARAQALKPAVRELATPPAQKDKFRLYLLVGQSNMAGRGPVEAEDTVPNAHVLRLNQAGQWEVAKDPVHFDKPVAGVGPGLTFGKDLAGLEPGVVIGLIPCAVGGSAIAHWQPGAYFDGTKTYPYDDALARARAAMQAGTLAGIIWHQGESDSNPEKSEAYGQNLTELIARFRQDLQAPNVPFVAGQLPVFQLTKPDANGQAAPNGPALRVNAAIAKLTQKVPHYAYIPATDTHDGGDHIHLDAASARLLGQRYATAMHALQAKKAKPTKRP
jgi:hypothetical protein